MTRIEWAWTIALAIVWTPGLLQLASVWSEVEYASHGFLVPFVALWAATAHRVELARLPPVRTPAALFGIGLATLGYVLGLLADNPSVTGLAAVATVVSTLLYLRGPAWVRTLRFALGYLIFMVPIPVDWITPLIVQLQLWVSSAAVGILQFAGVAIYREGNILHLPGDESLFVAEACSGITSLITLIPIGVFIAYFTESLLTRRLILIASVLPIALAGNLLRVLLTVGLATRVDIAIATEGPLHEWAGVGTYVIGCLSLLAIGAGMRRFMPAPEAP